MTKSHRSNKVRAGGRAAAGSWIALVAATTLGDAADALRAEVRAQGLSEGNVYRLVVQSYDAASAPVSGRRVRPVGSAQRVVTADELRQGVHVSLLEIRSEASLGAPSGGPVVLAWIDAGKPELDFDARMARPGPGSVYGVARRAPHTGVIQISLNRTLSA